MTQPTTRPGGGWRVLVAIASHGTKNLRYLEQVLAAYRAMTHDVDIVVLSDREKDLGPDVEVRVGAPTSDPRSLPFAHRRLFADRLEDYDLFIYSEDDTLVEQRHVDAFVELDSVLAEDEVPGFLRFEVHPDGRRSYCSIHSFYRWDPDSVGVRGGEVVATYTNDHAACYILTRQQLRRAIASGGFLVEPHHGPYDMLVSAATDPYTRCGLRRRVVVSRIDDLLLAHLPNVYLGRLGVDEDELRTQVAALVDIAHGRRGRRQLLEPGSALASPEWDVPQHASATPELASLLPADPRRTLTVGCTSGALELGLGLDPTGVVAVPIDEVVGAVAARRGLTVLAPDLAALDDLDDGTIDLVLVHQVLHHVPDPAALLRRLCRLLAPGGRIIVSVPNLRHERLRSRAGRSSLVLPRRGFEVDGVHAPTPASLRRWAHAAGLELADLRAELTPGVRRRAGWLEGIAQSWVGHTLHVELRPTLRPLTRPGHLPVLETPGEGVGDMLVPPSPERGGDGWARTLLVSTLAATLVIVGVIAVAMSSAEQQAPAADTSGGVAHGGVDGWTQESAEPGVPRPESDERRRPLVEVAGMSVGPGTTGPRADDDPGGRVDDLEPSGTVASEHHGEVIVGLDIEGEIRIAHDDVVVEHVRIRSGDSPYAISYVEGNDASGAVVRHVEIDGEGNAEQIGVFLGDVHLSHSNIHGVRVGAQVRSGAVVERNHIHDLAADDDTHGTAVSVHGGTGVVIRDNNLEGSTSAALSLYPRLEPIEDVLVEGNLFNGGSYCVYAGYVDKEYREDNRDIRFVANAFGRARHPDCGIHGPATGFEGAQPGNRWEDNVWADSGEPIG